MLAVENRRDKGGGICMCHSRERRRGSVSAMERRLSSEKGSVNYGCKMESRQQWSRNEKNMLIKVVM